MYIGLLNGRTRRRFGSASFREQILAMAPDYYFPMAAGSDLDGSYNMADAAGNLAGPGHLEWFYNDSAGTNFVPSVITDGSGPTEAPDGYFFKDSDQQLSLAASDGGYWRTNSGSGSNITTPDMSVDGNGVSLSCFFRATNGPLTSFGRVSRLMGIERNGSAMLSITWSGYTTPNHPAQSITARDFPGSGTNRSLDWGSTAGVSSGEWHHYLARRYNNGGSIEADVFVDGVQYGGTLTGFSGTGWSSTSDTLLTIGGASQLCSSSGGTGCSHTDGDQCHAAFFMRKVDPSEFFF